MRGSLSRAAGGREQGRGELAAGCGWGRRERRHQEQTQAVPREPTGWMGQWGAGLESALGGGQPYDDALCPQDNLTHNPRSRLFRGTVPTLSAKAGPECSRCYRRLQNSSVASRENIFSHVHLFLWEKMYLSLSVDFIFSILHIYSKHTHTQKQHCRFGTKRLAPHPGFLAPHTRVARDGCPRAGGPHTSGGGPQSARREPGGGLFSYQHTGK